MDAGELKERLNRSLLSFPLTDFDQAGALDLVSFRKRLEWLGEFGADAEFIAGGAGEFFSLRRKEYSELVAAAVDLRRGSGSPILASAGYGTAEAIEYVREAENLGADGILLLPPYLTEMSQDGARLHIEAVCKSTRLGVIVYNRANCRLTAATVARLADSCPNFVSLKDGIGDFEELYAISALVGDRVSIINGMPTAEVFAPAFRGLGVHTYSSAIFNFLPVLAHSFYRALITNDHLYSNQVMQRFLMPYVALRKRQNGYAVSIVKAGVDAIGKSAGPVRPPLSSLTEDERAQLQELITIGQELERGQQ